MKIVGVISSPNPNGNTATLVRETLKVAVAEGALAAEIYLPDYRIEFCTGCSRCMAEGSCHISDEFESLKQMLYEADGIVLSSPTYGGSMSAMLKRLIERLGMYERFTSMLGGKYLVGISTCGSTGAGKVAGNLVQLMSGGIFQRGYISGVLGVGLHGKKIADDEKTIKKAYALGRKMAKDIRKHNHYPFQNLAGRVLNFCLMKPMFRDVLHKHREGFLKAVYCNLQQRGLI